MVLLLLLLFAAVIDGRTGFPGKESMKEKCSGISRFFGGRDRVQRTGHRSSQEQEEWMREDSLITLGCHFYCQSTLIYRHTTHTTSLGLISAFLSFLLDNLNTIQMHIKIYNVVQTSIQATLNNFVRCFLCPLDKFIANVTLFNFLYIPENDRYSLLRFWRIHAIHFVRNLSSKEYAIIYSHAQKFFKIVF